MSLKMFLYGITADPRYVVLRRENCSVTASTFPATFPQVDRYFVKHFMQQARRQEQERKLPPVFEQSSSPAPVANAHSSGEGAIGTMPFVPTKACPEEAARAMAHWADPERDTSTAPASPQPDSESDSSDSDSPSSFSKLWGKAGSTLFGAFDAVNTGANWLGSKIENGATWIGSNAEQAASGIGETISENWYAGRSALLKSGRDFRHAAKQEGWLGAFMDPFGALDRQQAQRELSDRFQVVPNQFVGPRLPNQVTEEEYAQVARNYSDIRLGRGDLTIDSSAYKSQQQRDAYESGVLDDVASLMQTRSGRREIEQLHNNGLRDETGKERHGIFGIPLPWGIGSQIHHQTTMVPLLEQDGMPNKRNGHARPDGKGDARAILGDGTLGASGSGTNVHLLYNPRLSVGDAFPEWTSKNPWLGELRSDLLLAHEMNHAIQQTQGMVDNRLIRDTDNRQNPADPAMAHDATATDEQHQPLRRVEHQAVGLGLYAGSDMTENRYRAERRDIAAAQGKGQLEGDSTLHQRDAYAIWEKRPASAASLSPASVSAPDIEHPRGHGPAHGKHRKHHSR